MASMKARVLFWIPSWCACQSRAKPVKRQNFHLARTRRRGQKFISSTILIPGVAWECAKRRCRRRNEKPPASSYGMPGAITWLSPASSCTRLLPLPPHIWRWCLWRFGSLPRVLCTCLAGPSCPAPPRSVYG